jgi:phasin family protein
MPGQPPDFDMMKMFADFRLPAMPDMAALAAAQRRNLEALSAANRVALEGAQAVARRHMEIMQASMTEMTQAMTGLAVPAADPKEAAARQIETLKAAYEKAVANIREVADLIQTSNAEALAVLNTRFAEAMEEAKQMAGKG